MSEGVHCYVANDESDPFVNGTKGLALSAHIEALVDAAPDKAPLIEIIFNQLWPGIWSGALSPILEARSTAFMVLTNHSDRSVRSLVLEKLAVIEREILRERDAEAREDRRREQGFE